MSIPSSVLTGPMADLRLQQLGLTAAELYECMFTGYSAAATCTDHDPRSLPGTLAWAKGIGHLRDVLKPRGWKADRASNYETAMHPTNAHAVAISSGTSQTGIADGPPPRTKTPKGPATSRAVKRNAQLSLGQGTGVFAGAAAEVDDEDRETWILLHYFDTDAEEIRLELSSPLTMEGKQITAWRERIILPPFDFATDVEIDFTTDPEDDLAIDIDVPRRRAD